MFETTAQFEARRQKAQASRADIERRYAGGFDAAAEPYRKRVVELRLGTYPLASAEVEFTAYNADASLLTARINGETYRFNVAPEKAKSMYEQSSMVSVEQTLDAASLALVDPTTRDKFSASREPNVHPKDGLRYVWIPAGTFTMGCSPADRKCSDNEKPVHEVTISKGFWMGATEVTQEAYQRVMGSNPSHFKGARLPVENITWDDAQAYCQAAGMRLPTESEWEYAALGGAAHYGPLDAVAWYDNDSSGKTHEVGQKQANAFGLYDMLGNVWEWVADWYGIYFAEPATDPQGPKPVVMVKRRTGWATAPSSGQYRVQRGGSSVSGPRDVRASERSGSAPKSHSQLTGVRCVGR
jgi:formylglycine-generating enzyme required for sulfatase activity